METFILILLICSVLFPVYHMINSSLIMRNSPSYLNETCDKEKGISVLIPCYNEASILKTTIESLNALKYDRAEFIFINDGSTDETLKVLDDLLELKPISKKYSLTKLEFMPIKKVYQSKKYPNMIVLDKVNGGKADALNAGIIVSSNNIIVTLDADSILDNQSLSIINNTFEDKSIIAAGGMVHVLQGRKMVDDKLVPSLKSKFIVRLQLIEYLRGFYVYKASLAKSNALSIISGAFGIFRRDVLLEVNGYRRTVGEDIDITMKIQKYLGKVPGSRIVFIPEACCYTEVPESWKDLYKQRIRWQKAYTDCLVLYFRDLCKTVLSKRLSFFFLVDSFFTGIICTYVIVVSFFILLFFINPLSLNKIFIYLIFSSFCSFIYNLISLRIARKYAFRLSSKEYKRLLHTLIGDLLILRFFNIVVVCIGTIAYFIRKGGWNKVSRTGRDYTLEQAS
ncbi:glycosyltransferase [Sutcliffiella horikoshii]|uniref:glycosyltransferase n=1 Tax=Sutcliffiella horikoshii TaxID=79883 RepID=UPI00203A7AC2|nr:glycosyltransferase [Sutcliffiella horikoshii]MCM3618853.1 glycosyltransferase [Sutcliffiella horikoshii]